MPNATAALTIAYQGLPGAFGEQAAVECFPQAQYLPCEHFHAVFDAVKSGRAHYGLLPIENSTGGSIDEVYDLLGSTGCSIVREHIVPVFHCLLAKPGVKTEDIRAVYSHAQALRQCSQFLQAHHWNEVPYFNTAISAQFVSESPENNLAAIASERAARYYGLNILQPGIQDRNDNYTRFVVVAARAQQLTGQGKVSLAFTLRHTVGSLHAVLAIFASHGLNLCKIESRNIPGRRWEYRFYVDYEGDLHQEAIERILSVLQAYTTETQFLGCYPPDRIWGHTQNEQ